MAHSSQNGAQSELLWHLVEQLHIQSLRFRAATSAFDKVWLASVMSYSAKKQKQTTFAMENAARNRLAEARSLASTDSNGSIYLCGYVIEMTLKCAYCRLSGLSGSFDVEGTVKQIPNNTSFVFSSHPLLGKPEKWHNVLGWFDFVMHTRNTIPTLSSDPFFNAKMRSKVKYVADIWGTFRRYDSRNPVRADCQRVLSETSWVFRNRRRLWK
ncbi:MAG TPA: hypothetical protein VK171_05240 [Fimbriimonas sp.]|nr:hypothetical protein [Fimbriimonas sp.]